MKIAVIGSGNVATHLTCGLCAAGHEIAAVYSRTPAHARELAGKVGARVLSAPDELVAPGADAVLVSLADSCAAKVVASLPALAEAVVLHTSGTLPQEILLPVSNDAGILYPLQTFSKDVPVDLHEVPFFIEGTSARAVDMARALASSLSPKVHYADATRRKLLHIAGVLSCNFPNYLWECCEKLLAEAGYPLDVVEPLVRATVAKAFSVGPHKAQTGPARRRDMVVIETHAAALPDGLSGIYRALSEEIIKSHYEQDSI